MSLSEKVKQLTNLPKRMSKEQVKERLQQLEALSTNRDIYYELNHTEQMLIFLTIDLLNKKLYA